MLKRKIKMNNYEIYGEYTLPRHPSSAQEFLRMLKSRNPIIETDKNIECLVYQIQAMQIESNKQHNITLAVSICCALFAGLTFVLALIQFFVTTKL